MAVKRPLVRYADTGRTEELRAADTLPGGGGALTKGSVTVNCGVGSDQARTTVLSASVAANSVILITVDPAGTADHSADEHLIEAYDVMPDAIVPGVSFDVVMVARDAGLDGNYAFLWAIA
jgi:hypothetical protein